MFVKPTAVTVLFDTLPLQFLFRLQQKVYHVASACHTNGASGRMLRFQAGVGKHECAFFVILFKSFRFGILNKKRLLSEKDGLNPIPLSQSIVLSLLPNISPYQAKLLHLYFLSHSNQQLMIK